MMIKHRSNRKNRYGVVDKRLGLLLSELDIAQREVLELCQRCSLTCKQKAVPGAILSFTCTAFK